MARELTDELKKHLENARRDKKKVKVKHLVGERKGEITEVEPDAAKMMHENGFGEIHVDDGEEQTAAEKEAIDQVVKAAQAGLTASEARITRKVLDAVNKGFSTNGNVEVLGEKSALSPTRGFESIGHFFGAVSKHYRGLGTDERLIAKHVDANGVVSKADGMSEGVLGDGGALVPVEYANWLYRDVLEEDSLLKRCRKVLINNGNSIYVPVRTTTTYGQTDPSTGGSLGAWLGPDGSAITPTKPAYNRVQLLLNRWAALLPVTEELLLDNNVGLGQWIGEEGRIALAYDLNNVLVNGLETNSQPQGILNSPALVYSAIVSGQTNYTIVYDNLVSMKSRLWTPLVGNFKTCIWLAHPDCEAQFEQLTDAAGRNLYYATGTIQQSQEAKLFGLPVVYSYQCSPVGSSGDVVLCDLSQYLVGLKQGEGVRQATSMHLYFASAEMAYRLIFRIDGKTARTAPLAVPNSAATRSGFVALMPRGGTS